MISAPAVGHGPILGGSAQISGGKIGEEEAKDLAAALKNPLPMAVEVTIERGASEQGK